jgi:hypothetical protein
MTRMTLLCLLCAGCATSSTTAFYPLDELRALDAPETRAELLAHALDVAPSKRDDTWRGLVERAASATLGEVDVKNVASAERALALADELPAKFPFLKKSAPWLASKAQAALSSLGWVMQSSRSREWTARVLELAREDATTPHFAQRLADEVVLKQLTPATALPLYALALTRDGASLCVAPNLPKVVLGAIDWGEETKALIKTCWKQLEAPFIEAITKAETRTEKLKVCAAVAEQQEAAAALKAVCTF